MAFVDESSGKIVVRIIYDGPAMVGKTTNVEQLSRTFKHRSQLALDSAEGSGARTRFLDWLQVDTGLVSGRRLSSHFITVPGQRVLNRRRLFLLGLADAVVFVASADPEHVEENRACYRSLLERLGDRRVPILFQLNKTDHPDALSEADLRRILHLDAGTRVVAANAREGNGVRETAVLALRLAADEVQDQVVRDGIESLDGPRDGPEDLVEHIRESEQKDGRSLVEVVLDARPLQIEADEPEDRVDDSEAPPLPTLNVASGLIWPANDGRELMQRALNGKPRQVDSLDPELMRYESGLWELTGHRVPEAHSVDGARSALLVAVRRSLKLEGLLQPRCCLCMSGGLRRYWLWRLAPRIATLHEGLEYGANNGQEDYVSERLTAFVHGLSRLRDLERSLSVHLPQSLHDFGYLDGQIHYLRADLGARLTSLEESLALPLRQLPLSPACLADYRDCVLEVFGTRVRDAVLDTLPDPEKSSSSGLLSVSAEGRQVFASTSRAS